ncbi:MobA/MobL family protein [Undibacterium sp. Ji50W]|uniref:MobA/MobL family protein n=1 Tax=Undibacterium sp. Ji50W TaxID=3413041 RepID=UPI003BF3149E
MASYHCSIKSGKRGKAASHADYIVREGRHARDEETSDLIAKAYGNLPDWSADDPRYFWKMADKHERVNGAAYREYVLALPQELCRDQQLEIVREFIASEIGSKPYQFAVHSPVAALGKTEQPHAHVMYSDRIDDGIDRLPEQHFKRYNSANPELGGCKKDSGGKDRIAMKEALTQTRATWAQIQNSALEQSGYDVKVDHRSNKDRGIERVPEKHLGFLGVKKMSAEEKQLVNNLRQSGGSTQTQMVRVTR